MATLILLVLFIWWLYIGYKGHERTGDAGALWFMVFFGFIGLFTLILTS